ncbi:unnamed protein product [Rangifer tarandus platyrhynchus]|uniref:Uncharacterized protein n=1 Tax=Rangifer tarandus platyrhynchus TaxID=3082113 RepID=A0ABN8ZX70_RANTA|nr:unnamed protein product [Rangifer tarandus platyrhynchus]
MGCPRPQLLCGPGSARDADPAAPRPSVRGPAGTPGALARPTPDPPNQRALELFRAAGVVEHGGSIHVSVCNSKDLSTPAKASQ